MKIYDERLFNILTKRYSINFVYNGKLLIDFG
jgi:hypothetical protein